MQFNLQASIGDPRADAAFDRIGVKFDAAVVEKPSEPIPVVQGVADALRDERYPMRLDRDRRRL